VLLAIKYLNTEVAEKCDAPEKTRVLLNK